jgi:hypothetical protein
MGNCIYSNCIYPNAILNDLSSQFLDCFVLDKKHNIIIGIYSNSNSNSMININQGICIGYKNNLINKIEFGIIHSHFDKIVELFFENSIKLILKKNKDSENIKLTLIYDNNKIDKFIGVDMIKKFKPINNNSEYIDLICNILD